MLLQSETAIALQNGAISITKWGMYYKAAQLLLQSGADIIKWGNYLKVQKASETNTGGQKILTADSLIHP